MVNPLPSKQILWVQIPLITFLYLCPFSLVVRTLPFHGKNTGSNPVKDTFIWKNNSVG